MGARTLDRCKHRKSHHFLVTGGGGGIVGAALSIFAGLGIRTYGHCGCVDFIFCVGLCSKGGQGTR